MLKSEELLFTFFMPNSKIIVDSGRLWEKVGDVNVHG